MSSVHHLWERTLMAVNCMCRNGSFEERLERAYTSAFEGLIAADAPPELTTDLAWILSLCEKNHVACAQRKPVAIKEADQAVLREKLLRLFVKTTQLTAPGARG